MGPLCCPLIKLLINLTSRDRIFFRYLQVRDYVQKKTSLLLDQSISDLEKQIFLPKVKTTIKLSYSLLKEYPSTNNTYLQRLWEKELGMEICNEDWDSVWSNANSLSVCNRVKALQLKILHRAHVSPSQRSKFNSVLSPLCLKCKIEVGTLTHCYWSCTKIKCFWFDVKCELDKIFSSFAGIECNPLTFLLGITDVKITAKYERRLFRILTFCARKCVLLNWISDKIPCKKQWQRLILEYVSLDFLTCKLYGKDDVFRKIWDPFMRYIGIDISTLFYRGFL